MSDYDVIIIGGGPGGYLAAERLGHAKKKVLLVEKDSLGGTCLNVGCIPTKSLLNSAKLYVHAQESAQFGVEIPEVSYGWNRVQEWKQQVVKTLVGGVGAAEKRAGVEVIRATATLNDSRSVEVNGEVKTADHIIIATGSEPVMPPIPGAADNPLVVDSTGLLATESVPKRLAIVGGGVIGIEFASLFAAFGSQVQVIEMLPEIVPFMDNDLAANLRKALKEVDFQLGAKVTRIDGATIFYDNSAGESVQTEADLILMAVGRRPVIAGWGAEEAGLDFTPRGITVNDICQTNLPNVWAIGDVTGRSLLAHAAYRMADVVAANILDPANARERGEIFRANTVPWAVYSMPEAAGVGLTEAAAKAAGYEIVTATVPLLLSGRFIAENGVKAPGAVKLIADKDTRIVLGIHMLGPYAPETIWGASAIIEAEFTVEDLRQVIFPHPTVSEGIREAAWAVKDH